MNIIFIFLIYVICSLIRNNKLNDLNSIEEYKLIQINKNEDIKIYFIMIIFCFYLFFSSYFIKEL